MVGSVHQFSQLIHRNFPILPITSLHSGFSIHKPTVGFMYPWGWKSIAQGSRVANSPFLQAVEGR